MVYLLHLGFPAQKQKTCRKSAGYAILIERNKRRDLVERERRQWKGVSTLRTGTVPSFARRNYLRMASIFLAFAILSNVFYIPCYYYIRQVTRSNVLEYHQRKLDTGMRTFTMSFNALSTLDEQLFQDPNYRSITYPNTELTPQQLTTMRSIISNALSPYDFIAEAGLSCGDEVLFNRQHLFFQRELLRAGRFFACSRPDFLSEFEGQQCVLPGKPGQALRLDLQQSNDHAPLLQARSLSFALMHQYRYQQRKW